MPRVFGDPAEELEFIGAVEEELERLAVGCVLDDASARRAHEHYRHRRLELTEQIAAQSQTNDDASSDETLGAAEHPVGDGE